MGKGKGKLSTWLIEIPSGVYIFEFKNLRFGRLKYFLNQTSQKLPAKTKIFTLNNSKIPLVYSNSKKISYDIFW